MSLRVVIQTDEGKGHGESVSVEKDFAHHCGHRKLTVFPLGLDIVKEAPQGRRASGATNQPAVKANAEHTGNPGLRFLIKAIECVLEVMEESVGAGESRGLIAEVTESADEKLFFEKEKGKKKQSETYHREFHIVHVQSVGNGEMVAVACNVGVVRKVVVVRITVIQERDSHLLVLFQDNPPCVHGHAARIPSDWSHAARRFDRVDSFVNVLSLNFLGDILQKSRGKGKCERARYKLFIISPWFKQATQLERKIKKSSLPGS
jgi:hypothetical protein